MTSHHPTSAPRTNRPDRGAGGPLQPRSRTAARHAQKLHRGRFSEGVEQRPESPRKRRVGRYSDGVDHDLLLRPEVLRGSFASVAAPVRDAA